MTNPVVWFEISVQDMARARAFYETVLAVTMTRMDAPDMEYWFFPMNPTGEGSGGALMHMPGMPSGGNSTIVYFKCDDYAIEAARVVPAGGRIFKDKMAIGQYGFMVLATDPDGNMIGLHSMK